MGKTNLYTVKDYQTGEILAKGTAGELEASGIVPKGYHTSEWAKHENQKRRNRKYAVTFEERQPEAKRGEKGRMMSVYTCYDAADNVLAKGTAKGLKKPKVRPKLRKIKDPTPLDYDVHDLMTYNAIAKKEGRPELTYGYWAAAGKPARP